MNEYIKDYDKRNEIKKETNKKSKGLPYPKERQVWRIKLGVNIWYEADGKEMFLRPVLVMKRIGTLYRVIPLTTKYKENRFHYTLLSNTFWKEKSIVILSQWRVVDKKRFTQFLWYVSLQEFEHIKKLLKDMYLPGVD